MQRIELEPILDSHKKWLNNEIGGKRACLKHEDLIGADLIGAKLRNANLIGADLRDADLIRADLIGANLRHANLRDANLRNADLIGANLRNANLIGADLIDANLIGADLRDANLIGADLIGANLRDADLIGANLRDAKINHNSIGITSVCPQEGSFIAYKKARGKLIKLLVPEDALRSSATTRKCRCNKAKVLEIEGDIKEVASSHDENFIYRVGEVVEVKDFDLDRWNECSTGIHFFIDKQEAINY